MPLSVFPLLVLPGPLVDCSLEVELPAGFVLVKLSDTVVVDELDELTSNSAYLVPMGHEFLQRGNEFYSRVLSPVK